MFFLIFLMFMLKILSNLIGYLDKYVENYNQMNKNNYDFDYLYNFRVKLVNSIIYINDNQYNVSVRQTSDISQLLTKDLIENQSLTNLFYQQGDKLFII